MSTPYRSLFTAIPTRLWDDLDGLTFSDVKVLGCIASYASPDREGWPKQQTIADRLKIARQSVNKSIKILVERGYVQATAQFRKDGGQRENRYRVLYDTPLDPLDIVSGYEEDTPPAPPLSRPEDTPPVTSGATPPVTSKATANKDELDHKNKPPNPQRGDEIETVETAFAEIWALWPEQGRKHSPGAALCRRAMEKHAEGIPLASLVAAVAAFVKSADPRYAPSLSKWFRERKFEAWLPKHQPAAIAGGASAFSTDLPPPPTEKAAKCLAAIRSRYGHTAVTTWFRDATWDGDLIRVPTTFQRDRIEATFGGVLYEHGFQAVEGSAAA